MTILLSTPAITRKFFHQRILINSSGLASLFLMTQLVSPAMAQLPVLNTPTAAIQPTVTTSIAETSAISAAENYVLGAGDTVRVDVFRLPEYSGEYEVLVNGALNLPMVGQVAIAGLTLEQSANAVSQAYAKRLRRPIINVYLVNPRPLRVGIVGEIARPGEYILQREGTQFPSLISALEVAGGVTQSADLRQMVINRSAADGTQQTIVANLWQFLETGNLSYNAALRDGDTVFIPTRKSFDPAESMQLAAASFAANESNPLNIAVVGEVFRPGPYTITGTARTNESGAVSSSRALPTVTRAIQVAGGIQPEADLRGVKVYRRTRNGSEQVIDVDLWQLLTDGNIIEDVALQEGDTVYIPQAADPLPGEISEVASASFSPAAIRINVVGEVDRPGTVEVPPNTPLSQGVLAAGGFNNRASTGVVELVRLNANGTASRSSLPVDFAEGLDSENNPLLRNNDTIIVRRSASANIADTLDTFLSPLGKAFSLFTIPASIFGLFD